MLLEREFFQSAQLKLIYENGKYRFEIAQTEGRIPDVFAIDISEERKNFDVVWENLDSSVAWLSREKLRKIFESVESLNVEPIKNNYCVKVYLKDESLFRLAPRRENVRY